MDRIEQRRTLDDGLCRVIKELHDRIDAEVAGAYGWPVDLDDQAILARLVALNRERRDEEARGEVRWLRPDFQAPRHRAKIDRRAGLDLGPETAVAAGLPAFPSARDEQAAAILDALARAPGPATPAELAALFKKAGKRAETRIAEALPILARYGWAAADDQGRWSLALRRAA